VYVAPEVPRIAVCEFFNWKSPNCVNRSKIYFRSAKAFLTL